MPRPESVNDALFHPLSSDAAERIAGGAVAPPAATFERYIDVLPDGTIAYGYVQVD